MSDPGRRRMRFLFLCPNLFPPRHVDVAVLFGRELGERRSHAIDFLLQSKAPCRRSYTTRWLGNRVFVGPTDLGVRAVNRLRKRLLDLRNNLRVFSLIRRNRYDFLLVKDRFLSGALSLLAARIARTPYVYWLSYPYPEANLGHVREGTARYPAIYYLRGKLYGLLLYRLILPHADHVFVQSDRMKQDIAGHPAGIPAERMTPVPMGVSLEEMPDPAPAAEPDDENKRVVYLGTLLANRRMDFLIHAFSQVAAAEPKAVLCMVGEGGDPSDIEGLKDLAEALGIGDRVRFTGFLPFEEAWDHVRRAAVCVSPFYPSPILRSTSPTKLVEYMALGKAVVANDHPEQRRVIAESGAGLCVPYDPAAFGDAIVTLLRDPDRRRAMGRRGRRYVERHRDYPVIADFVEGRLREVLKIGDG